MEAEVAVVGAGVVGSATALAVARRGASCVLLEAESEPGLRASGTNSGILHTGFDSPPGELETELILRAAELRDSVLETLGVPLLRCGALVPQAEALAANARVNGVETRMRDGGMLEVPGEAVTDPVVYTLSLAAAAQRHGAELWTGFRVSGIEPRGDGLVLTEEGGTAVSARVVVNCAGLYADAVARLTGDASFEIYPRKGEFLVFDPRADEQLERILLPVPSKRTKGVLVFPTLDGMVVAGPTAVDIDDKEDWSVRPAAREEIVSKASALWPPLADLEPVAAYAGLRPAGRGVNYVIGRSTACSRLVNAAAIRSTGMTASLGIGERVCAIVGSMGVNLGPEAQLAPGAPRAVSGPWWRRTAERFAA